MLWTGDLRTSDTDDIGMTPEERSAHIRESVRLTESASAIVCSASARASSYGCKLLQGAHTYLYATLITDFIKLARRDDCIGSSGVRMNDGSIKTTDDFLIDHLFNETFRPLLEKAGGEKFLSEVRRKSAAILNMSVSPTY